MCWKLIIDGKSYKSDCDSLNEAIKEVVEEIVMSRRYSDLEESYSKLTESIGGDYPYDGVAQGLDGSEYKFNCNANLCVEAECFVGDAEIDDISSPEIMEAKKLERAGNHPDQIVIDL